ncbi:hypothetical protein RRG08_063836 [Elysia crispata]|uniref:Uncharacterized protein n=1 Tax=Elysia crispata TaxID=231223 RepID=A0AAE0Y5G2_9GAST|nr:hypothetical protein RRG08_063836 [Elysia crispata]
MGDLCICRHRQLFRQHGSYYDSGRFPDRQKYKEISEVELRGIEPRSVLSKPSNLFPQRPPRGDRVAAKETEDNLRENCSFPFSLKVNNLNTESGTAPSAWAALAGASITGR